MPARKHTLEKLQEQSKRRYEADTPVLKRKIERYYINVNPLPEKTAQKKLSKIKRIPKVIDWNKIKKFAV